MLEQAVVNRDVVLRTHAEAVDRLTRLYASTEAPGTVEVIGRSEEQRDIVGLVVGKGSRRVSLIAGNHADEPVGPETLRCLLEEIAADADSFAPLLDEFTFVVVPHTNPDGEERNRRWIERWPDADAYLEHAYRELPGRDVEFAFPDGRTENRAVAAFLQRNGPYAMHCSLHGMGFSDGAFLLIERRWGFRTHRLQTAFRAMAASTGLALHDHNRQGEKGFFYLGPGFNTTPEGSAMRAYFRSLGDEEMAARFGLSSMEFVRSLGGDPLCLVTEMPLFVISGDQPSEPGLPGPYLTFLERVRNARGSGDEAVRRRLIEDFDVRPLDLKTAMRVQLGVIEEGLREVA